MNRSSLHDGYMQKVLASIGQMIWAIVCGTLLILLAMFFIVREVANQEREPTNANALDVKRKIAQEDDSIAIIGLDRLIRL